MIDDARERRADRRSHDEHQQEESERQRLLLANTSGRRTLLGSLAFDGNALCGDPLGGRFFGLHSLRRSALGSFGGRSFGGSLFSCGSVRGGPLPRGAVGVAAV